MVTRNLSKFIKCEFKFLIWLTVGLLILNGIGLLFQYIFNTALLVSIAVSIIVLMLYVVVFLYQFIKIISFQDNYICINAKERVSGWLSSLV